MLGFAGRDLATRKAPPILSNFQLGIYGFAMLVPVGALILMVTGDPVVPNLKDTGLLVLAAAVGVLAYWSLTCAMRVGEISVVTPFRYIRLPFALVLGAAAFGERPDLAMVVGSVLIVGSGIYTLTQARRLPGVADEGVDPRVKR
jgi:drug/metabolite transporter (DMT)-like permease